jgi:phosphate transport system permease protein
MRRKNLIDILFKYFGLFCTLLGLIILMIFIFNITRQGLGRINWEFLTNLPSRIPERAGIYTAIAGTLWIMVLTSLIAIPLGIGAGIYLEEYGKKNRFAKIVELNITNLAGVPSIIYGLLGLEIFGRILNLQGSLLAGSATLALLIVPIIVVSTRESLKAVPKTIREASYALGASKFQTIRFALIPASISGIITGIILAISRAVGEAAPLIVIGALAYVPFVPTGPASEFTVLPIQIFNWVSRPQHGFMINASAAIIIMLLITFLFNSIAVYLRLKRQKYSKW